ncbi:MAG: sigma-70 family RNA polymerase sigma factor [Lachnospiraceae bacterium]|nr:sigma-70 family RNA polymerase sigma factor [Lachnospiraceae bacterium]
MDETKKMQEKLIKEFTEEYMEPLFYFCLKKTGDSEEAQDLTQDIALNILTALNGKIIPANFSAWVWKIARNRYSVWADRKHRRAESVTGTDIADYEIADENTDLLESVIHSEQLALLREGLAFISGDYRDILVAYYIEDRSVRDIADALSLSQDTVKQRLHRARKILKEGMNMAREFGRLSFKPENIVFDNSGRFGMWGEPWKYLNRILCKNILLAAYRNPSTAEELAIEVGVALPYMEAELEDLTGATLLHKVGNKYEANLMIVSAVAQEKVNAHMQGMIHELTEQLIKAMDIYTWRDEHQPGWHGGYQSAEDMRWTLLMQMVDDVIRETEERYKKEEGANPNIGPMGHTIRPNNGEWDVVGREESSCEFPAAVGLHCCRQFGAYQFYYKEIAEKKSDTLVYDEKCEYALQQVAMGEGKKVKKELLNHLEQEGYLVKRGDKYEPTFLVMYQDARPITEEQQESLKSFYETFRQVADAMGRHYEFCREQVLAEVPEFLKENNHLINHVIASFLYKVRGAVLEEAIRQGYLTYDEAKDNRMLGVYLYV